MGVIVPVGEYQASFIFSVSGITKDITWTLGLSPDVVDPPGSPSVIAEGLWNAFAGAPGGSSKPYAQDNMFSPWRFTGVSVALATADGPLVGEYFESNVGALTTNAMPVNCAVLMNKSTGLGGRKNRGRAYLPPCFPAESEVNAAGVISNTQVGAMQLWYDAAFEDIEPLGVNPCLHHSDGSAGTKITSVSVLATIATQRRRLR